MTYVHDTVSAHRPVIAISGGSAGLGRALAANLLTNGFAVALCARHADAISDTVRALSPLGPVAGWAGDVADELFRQQWIHHIIEQFGRLDSLVNNASTLGDVLMPALADLTAANLRQVLETNVISPLRLLQIALPWLTAAPAAVVVGISSDAAHGAYPGWGAYGASKAANALLHRTFANEWHVRPDGASIAVYVVDPGDMATAMHDAASPGDTGLANPEEVAAAMLPLFNRLLGESGPFPLEKNHDLCVQSGQLVIRGVH